ncbi:Uncharacterized protein BM_BM17761 [Brugia malayi]|uniref:Uncharacterized protein n=1 Tax=Brugia malayi TaxID=6279 RepID=A0A4E9FP13_BRUMA|nr:Uncharacterized protein BM_BM17761 [Brugia malayi]VIO98365.1 Uncharacterized protein BM_BM17761 [Brugia malayi]
MLAHVTAARKCEPFKFAQILAFSSRKPPIDHAVFRLLSLEEVCSRWEM